MTSRNHALVPLVETACAVVSGLLLIGVLAYAIVVGPGTELAVDESSEIGIALGADPFSLTPH